MSDHSDSVQGSGPSQQKPPQVSSVPICSVIVTYNPRPTLLENIKVLAPQVGQVMIVDNGSGANESLATLERCATAKVIRNYQNLGIAAALNVGVLYAIAGGFDWVVTLDQDSQVTSDFIAKMMDGYLQTPQPERVAFLCPTYVDRDSGVTLRLKRARGGAILTALSSGSMISSANFQKLGLFDETLYMDAVDIEYSLRARQKGMEIIQTPAVLLHSLGRTKYYRVCGLRFGVTNHSTARRYYMTRNRLRLLKNYAGDWPWVWRESSTMILDVVKIVFAEDSKWKKMRAMAAGTVDALFGRVGKQIEL
jgi:rhamnosyltransferase